MPTTGRIERGIDVFAKAFSSPNPKEAIDAFLGNASPGFPNRDRRRKRRQRPPVPPPRPPVSLDGGRRLKVLRAAHRRRISDRAMLRARRLARKER